MVKSKLKNKYT